MHAILVSGPLSRRSVDEDDEKEITLASANDAGNVREATWLTTRATNKTRT